MGIEAMARYWSQDAKNYHRIISAELQSFRAAAWGKLFQAKMPGKTHTILDMGCGPGFFTVLLGSMGYEVTAVDCSAAMLDRAKQTADAYGVKARFICMDCGAMEFPAGSFDVIVSRNVTWTLQDPVDVYERCWHMLRPGGRLLVFDANWQMYLFDDLLAYRMEQRRKRCIAQYGDDFSGEDELTEPLDVKNLPLSSVRRPYWDVDVLRILGYRNVYCNQDLTEQLWDDKEKLLYGETPLFGIFAEK